MAVYVIIGHTDLAKIGAAVAEKFPEPQSYALAPGAWYVEATGPSQAVSDALGITNGVLGAQAVVLPVNDQVGWMRRDLWDWVRPKVAIK